MVYGSAVDPGYVYCACALTFNVLFYFFKDRDFFDDLLKEKFPSSILICLGAKC